MKAIKMRVIANPEIDDDTHDESSENNDHPDISHIPNDQPIPSQNPEKTPYNIPGDEPGHQIIPGPMIPPMREPGRKTTIRVLNIEI